MDRKKRKRHHCQFQLNLYLDSMYLTSRDAEIRRISYFSKVETKDISNRSECLLKVGSTVTPSWFLLIKPWDSVDTVSGS